MRCEAASGEAAVNCPSGHMILKNRLSHHNQISSSDVFVHHVPGVYLAPYPRPLAQRQSEPAWTDRDTQQNDKKSFRGRTRGQSGHENRKEWF